MLFRSWLLTSNVRYTTGTAQARARISIGAAAANMGKDRYASFCHIEKCGVRPGWCSNADTGGLRERSAPAPTPTRGRERDDPRAAGDQRHHASRPTAGGTHRRGERKSDEWGKRESVCVGLGGSRHITNKKDQHINKKKKYKA